MKKSFYVYILSNQRRTVYYTGITNFIERLYGASVEKGSKIIFSKYNVNELLYFEEHDSSLYAIQREKQVKKWRREKKLNLIKMMNPEMRNLFI